MGDDVIFTPPSLFCIDNHARNIQARMKVTLPPSHSHDDAHPDGFKASQEFADTPWTMLNASLIRSYTVRARPGCLSALSVPIVIVRPVSVVVLHGHAGLLTAQNGAFRLGRGRPTTSGAGSTHRSAMTPSATAPPATARHSTRPSGG